MLDVGSYVSVSKNSHREDLVFGTSRAAAADISIAGGVVTISGVTAKVSVKHDGLVGATDGKADYGVININGQKFAIGPDGIEGGGQKQNIPGLPDDPNAALAELGLTVTVPKPEYEITDSGAAGTVTGLIVVVDTKTLAAALDMTPIDDILGQLPDQLGQLKSALQAAANLSPRFVYNIATVTSEVATSQGIAPPPVDPPPGPEDPDDNKGGDGGTGGGGDPISSGGTSTTPGSPGVPSSGGETDSGTETAPLPAVETTAGLPKLFSIPGLLLVGGIAGAALLGSYVRKLGLAALGGGRLMSARPRQWPPRPAKGLTHDHDLHPARERRSHRRRLRRGAAARFLARWLHRRGSAEEQLLRSCSRWSCSGPARS